MDEPAFICVSSAGGKKREVIPIRVIGRSGKNYRCRLEKDARLPNKAWGLKGEVIAIPTWAVKFKHPQPEQLNLLEK